MYISIFILKIDLGVVDGHEITVDDQTTPKPILITIKFTFNME